MQTKGPAQKQIHNLARAPAAECEVIFAQAQSSEEWKARIVPDGYFGVESIVINGDYCRPGFFDRDIALVFG